MSKTSQSRGSDKPSDKVYIDEKIGKYTFFGLGGFLILFAVLCVIKGIAQTEFSLGDLMSIGILVSLVGAVLCLIVVVVMGMSENSKTTRGKKSKLEKGPNLKLAE